LIICFVLSLLFVGFNSLFFIDKLPINDSSKITSSSLKFGLGERSLAEGLERGGFLWVANFDLTAESELFEPF